MCEGRIPSLYNTSQKQVFDHGSNDKERRRRRRRRTHALAFQQIRPWLNSLWKERREERRRKCGARAYNNFVNVSSWLYYLHHHHCYQWVAALLVEVTRVHMIRWRQLSSHCCSQWSPQRVAVGMRFLFCSTRRRVRQTSYQSSSVAVLNNEEEHHAGMILWWTMTMEESQRWFWRTWTTETRAEVRHRWRFVDRTRSQASGADSINFHRH